MIYSVCTLLSERDPEYRAKYRVTSITQGLGRLLCLEMLEESYVESQTWEEKDRGEEGGTTLNIKMSVGNREVRGFKAI